MVSAVYHNIPVDPVVGPEAIRGVLASFTTGVESIEFRVGASPPTVGRS